LAVRAVSTAASGLTQVDSDSPKSSAVTARQLREGVSIAVCDLRWILKPNYRRSLFKQETNLAGVNIPAGAANFETTSSAGKFPVSLETAIGFCNGVSLAGKIVV
jgi:hypothetical protein